MPQRKINLALATFFMACDVLFFLITSDTSTSKVPLFLIIDSTFISNSLHLLLLVIDLLIVPCCP